MCSLVNADVNVLEIYLYVNVSSAASLQPLLREDFDAKTFATTTIQCQMVGETLQKLANGIAALDKELYSQVKGLEGRKRENERARNRKEVVVKE